MAAGASNQERREGWRGKAPKGVKKATNTGKQCCFFLDFLVVMFECAGKRRGHSESEVGVWRVVWAGFRLALGAWSLSWSWLGVCVCVCV